MSRYAAGRRIALAVGFGALTGRLPAGTVIDRVVRLLGSPALAAPARRGLVVLDETTMGLLDTRFATRADSGVFVLLGERDGAEVRTLLGKPTPCVGRQRELCMLEGLLADCIGGGGAQAVLLTAPSGMGKSRLAQEFLRQVRHRSEPVAIWSGRGDPLRAGSALGLLGQVLRGACGVRAGERRARRGEVAAHVAERAPGSARRGEVAAHVAERAPGSACRGEVAARVAERAPGSAWQRVTELIAELIDAPCPDQESLASQTARRDARRMSDQVCAAFLDLLAAECARNPVVIVLEDLHWGDRATVQLLDRALRELREQPLFVLALARPEVHEIFPGLWVERVSQEIRLRGLNQRAIAQLARHALGDEARADTIDRLARLSEGNAFYLEELIRWTAEGREPAFPETLVAMVQSRLAALDPASRRVLRAASVFGESFWPGGVMALSAGDDAAALHDRLAFLTRQEILVKRAVSRFPGEDEYAFRHALLREGAYALLTEEDRVLGHRLAGAWLEAHGEQDALMPTEPGASPSLVTATGS
jgi:predicted ATPase